MAKLKRILICLTVTAVLSAARTHAEDTQSVSASRKQCTIMVDQSKPGRVVSKYLTGVNLSYFNDLDSLWADKRIPGYLRQIQAGLLRYPGGEETSRYHWEHPGTRGYRDVWNTEGIKGQKWTADDMLLNDDNHMDTLEYLQWCSWIGAEPMLGVNISSGIALDCLDESLEEIDRWYDYCKQHGYRVKYWYVDNEMWHKEPATYVAISSEEYAGIVQKVARLLKKKDSSVQIICNVHNSMGPMMKEFLETCGRYVDVIDLHWYWQWNNASFDLWASETPMKTLYGETYSDAVRKFESLAVRVGHDHIRLAAHEWNIGPSPAGVTISPYARALMTSEMMMQFAEGGLHSACLWPFIWSFNRERLIKQISNGTAPESPERSIISDYPPHEPLPMLTSFTMLSRMLGGTTVETVCDLNDVAVLAVQKQEYILVYVLNKCSDFGFIDLNIAGTEAYENAEFETLLSTNIFSADYRVETGICELTPDGARLTLPRYSLTLLTFRN